MNGIQRRTMRRSASWTALAALIAVLGAGCAAKVNRDVLSTVKKVGILSVTIDKLGTQPTDDEVMQSTVNYAARMYAEALSNRPEWKLAPMTSYMDNPAFRDFLKPPAPAPQKKPQAGTEDTSFAAKLNRLSERLNEQYAAATSLEAFTKRESAHYLGASGMPIVPYKMIGKVGATSSSTQTRKGSVETREDWTPLRKEMHVRVGELATKLNLDGLIVIYLRTAIRSTVGIGVTLGERGNDTVRMDPAMVLIAKNGKVAIDMGEPVIDALTPANAGVPLYKAEGHRGGTINLGKNRPDYIIDLKDPNGRVEKDLYALTDLALRHFLNDLGKELSEKK